MLGFGLTLLGGCVSPPDAGGNRLCYFPARSVTAAASSTLTMYLNATRRATAENMAASAHEGLFYAENVQKTGTRVSSNNWGLIAQSGDNGDVLFLSMCAKQGINDDPVYPYRTHLNITRANNTQKPADQPSLYISGNGLFSPKLIVSIKDASVSVTDSFSGEEKTTSVPLSDVRSAGDYPRYAWLGRNAGAVFQFVVSAYTNAGLGLHSRAQGMRTLPLGFDAVEALHEYQSNTLLEL